MHSTVLYFLIWNGNIYDHLFWFVIECAAQQYKDKEKKNLNHLFEPFLSLESAYNADNILSTYRAFSHLFSTCGASTHVSTFKHHAVHWVVHADLAQV